MGSGKKSKKEKKSKKKSKKSKKSKRAETSSSSSSDEWETAVPEPQNAPSQLFSHVEKTENSACLMNFDNIGETFERKRDQKQKSYRVDQERAEQMMQQRNIVNRSKQEAAQAGRPKYSLDFLRRSFFRMRQESQDSGESFEAIISSRYGTFDEFIGYVRKAEDHEGARAHWLGAKIPRNFKPQQPKPKIQQPQPIKTEPEIDWNADLNKLTAKAMRAGLMGKKDLEREINQQIAKIKQAQADGTLDEKQKETTQIMAMKTTKSGSVMPDKPKDRNLNESQMSVQQLLQHEKTLSRLGDESMLMKSAARGVSGKGDGKLDLDDMYDNVSDKKRKHKEIGDDKLERQLRDKAIANHKNKLRDRFYSGSPDYPKHCIAHQTQNFSVMVTPWNPLVPLGHCLIVPSEDNITSYLQLTRESLLQEYFTLREQIKSAIKQAYSLDVLFIHTCFNDGKQLYIECIPLEPRDNSAALGYFKQEILTSTGSQFNRDNQALRKLDDSSPLHRAMPRALMPYFAVETWYNGKYRGYLHIIEDFHAFGKNFAYEVIGGLLQLEDMHEHKYKKNTSFDSALKRRKELRLILETGEANEDQLIDNDEVVPSKRAKSSASTDLPLPPGREDKIYGPCFIPK